MARLSSSTDTNTNYPNINHNQPLFGAAPFNEVHTRVFWRQILRKACVLMVQPSYLAGYKGVFTCSLCNAINSPQKRPQHSIIGGNEPFLVLSAQGFKSKGHKRHIFKEQSCRRCVPPTNSNPGSRTQTDRGSWQRITLTMHLLLANIQIWISNTSKQ